MFNYYEDGWGYPSYEDLYQSLPSLLSYQEPVQTYQTVSQPPYSEPAYFAPQYADPVFAAPPYQEPVYSAPQYQEPIYSAPQYQQSVAPVYTPMAAPQQDAPAQSAYATPATTQTVDKTPAQSAEIPPATMQNGKAYYGNDGTLFVWTGTGYQPIPKIAQNDLSFNAAGYGPDQNNGGDSGPSQGPWQGADVQFSDPSMLSRYGVGPFSNSSNNWMTSWDGTDKNAFDLLLKSGDKEGSQIRYELKDGQYVPTLNGTTPWDTNNSFQNIGLLTLAAMGLGMGTLGPMLEAGAAGAAGAAGGEALTMLPAWGDIPISTAIIDSLPAGLAAPGVTAAGGAVDALTMLPAAGLESIPFDPVTSPSYTPFDTPPLDIPPGAPPIDPSNPVQVLDPVQVRPPIEPLPDLPVIPPPPIIPPSSTTPYDSGDPYHSGDMVDESVQIPKDMSGLPPWLTPNLLKLLTTLGGGLLGKATSGDGSPSAPAAIGGAVQKPTMYGGGTSSSYPTFPMYGNTDTERYMTQSYLPGLFGR